MMNRLNDAQQQAVSHFEGPCLVLAGPGSGKTRVITERIRYLTQERKVNGNEILVITFTKVAAMEMRQRYIKQNNNAGGGVRFGTFHAIFFMILKRECHYTADNIIRDSIKRMVLRDLLRNTELDVPDENEFLNELESEISRIKGDGITLENYYSSLCSGEIFQELFSGYEEYLKKKNLIDFDDMLVKCYELLLENKEVLRIWQQQFSYILIDEFQDICRVQYDIIKLLAAPQNHIFVVGDDDQSIYGFRGARPEIMKQFLADYPKAKQYLLDTNYRSEAAIVEAAGYVIAENTNRFPKKIVAGKQTEEMKSAETPVVIKEFETVPLQNEEIRKKILEKNQNGQPFHSMAVLFRTNTQARALSAKLMEFNIPFVMKETIPNLYEHWMVQDILTYMHIAAGKRDRNRVLRIINRPTRYVHRNAFTEAYVDWEDLKSFYEEKDWMVDRIEQLQYDLRMLAKMKPYAAVNFIRHGIDYDSYIRDYAAQRGAKPDTLLELLDELQEEAKEHNSFEEWLHAMEQYKEELKEQSEKRFALQNGQETEDAVMLLTFHGAKGLEYDTVFIPDANEGVTPHNKSVLAADMEEERRMFYVAMTRAKYQLFIYYTKERYHKDADVSRFVDEIRRKQE